MAFKLKEDHLLILIQYMEEHREFATGRLSVSNARAKFKDLWQELANKLNSLGYGIRPVEKWQKTWTDYKTNVKKMASKIKRYQEGTGGGPDIKKKLSKYELRVPDIMGTNSYAGCGVTEQGLQDYSNNNAAKDGSSQLPSPAELKDNYLDFSTIKKITSVCKNAAPKDDQNTVGRDHDYLSSPPCKPRGLKRKSDDSGTTLYRETIEALGSIETSIGNRLQSLENTVGTKLDALQETIAIGFQNVNSTLLAFLSTIQPT